MLRQPRRGRLFGSPPLATLAMGRSSEYLLISVCFKSVHTGPTMADLSVDELMNDQQLREFLGISRTTLWRLRKQGGIPFGKVGRAYRYRKSHILRWVTENPEAAKQLSLNLGESE